MAKMKGRDPYAPPPMHHDRSGAFVRVAILAALLGAAGLGYVWMSGQPRTALVPELAEEQMPDAGYHAPQDTLPEAASAAPPAAPAERAPEPSPAS